MHAVLSFKTIEKGILSCLSIAKRGFTTKAALVEIINAILYKLKSGCQWRMLPVKALFSDVVLSWNAVYHHFRKWSVSGEWQNMYAKMSYILQKMLGHIPDPYRWQPYGMRPWRKGC